MCIASIPYIPWQFCSSLQSRNRKESHFNTRKNETHIKPIFLLHMTLK
jgi:hypothetical protein